MLDSDIKECTRLLVDGGVIVFPTDTVYALSCNAYDDDAIEKLYLIKNREYSKRVSIFLPNKEEIKKFCVIDNDSRSLINEKMPGALTLVLPLKDDRLKRSKFFGNNIGIRIPTNNIACKILRGIDFPIVATSVNISGTPSVIKSKDIPSNIRSSVDKIIEYDDEVFGKESTIIDCIKKEVLRK